MGGTAGLGLEAARIPRSQPVETADLGTALDCYLYDRIVDFATRAAAMPLTEALGLSRNALAALIERFIPQHRHQLAMLPVAAGPGADVIEEPDIRAYLLECRATGDEAENWAAAIVARRSRWPNHLWQDMGFADRGELNLFLRRHFPDLVLRNNRDMKWKKFLYRELCQREGVPICRSPTCDACCDFTACFGGEPGEPLQALATLDRR